jgi:hypothetical protein
MEQIDPIILIQEAWHGHSLQGTVTDSVLAMVSQCPSIAFQNAMPASLSICIQHDKSRSSRRAAASVCYPFCVAADAEIHLGNRNGAFLCHSKPRIDLSDIILCIKHDSIGTKMQYLCK